MLTDNDLFQLISHSKGASLLRQVGEVIQKRHGLENMFDAEEVRKSKKLFETLGAELWVVSTSESWIITITDYCRPDECEMFDMEEKYGHIAIWNDRFMNDCRQHDMERAWDDDDDGESNYRGLKLEMLSWKRESVKRVLKSSGFAIFKFNEMFEDVEDKSDARTLYKRWVCFNVCAI